MTMNLLFMIAQFAMRKLRYHKQNRSDFVVISTDYFNQYMDGVSKGYVTFFPVVVVNSNIL